MLQITMTLTFGILTQTSIGIICRPWPSKTPIMVFLSLIGFKLFSGQGFYASDYRDLYISYPKIDREQLWVMANYDTYYGAPQLKLLSEQGLYAPGHCDHDLLPIDPKINRDHLLVMAN